MHINRGATLALNYNSFKPDHKYEHEFIVSIDQLFPAPDRWYGSRAPIISLDYYGAGVQSFAEIEAYGDTPGAEETMQDLGITDIVASSLPIERTRSTTAEGAPVYLFNSNLGAPKVVKGSVIIEVGENMIKDDGLYRGILFFDKLLVKEYIYNNMLFVEVRGFRSDQTGGTGSDFGKYDIPEIPPSASEIDSTSS